MTDADAVIERAMTFVAQSRAARERNDQRRREIFSRIQIAATAPKYQIHKHGEQLTLKLDS